MTKKKRVAIFGSSSNPPTGKEGHLALVRKLAEDFDQVLVGPVYRHIYSTKHNLADYDDRLEMARRCFAGMPNVDVSDVEKRLFDEFERQDKKLDNGEREPVGTFDVLQHLRSLPENQDIELTLALGGDTCKDLLEGKWKKSNEILALTKIVVFPRHGESLPQHDNFDIHIYDQAPTKGTSSTKAREACETGNFDALAKIVEPSVLAYIREKRLYTTMGMADISASNEASRMSQL
ncbi:Hypothetical Protein FCC1311_039622 [Hondaea fermentalgiana]|uniref:Cytidyltransferase-like domain-containing protein n=1 Tax=Hondaea fermentalgiana TaxID=2315210 RepID=A0A2R5GBM3_9STRA|nr:Hypothetical Protein FCC1311_039622 [Hondaea fermentalgiana]|eukprot:GBG27739.1 Hypothetical Protein FCC1311_039622 [Hondaea fermentalgiana]